MSFEKDLIEDLKKYFDIRELVDETTFKAHGESSWKFFDFRLLETMLFVREELGKPITINNWHVGGSFDERGLRTNLSPLVKGKTNLYLSAHILGKAVDFDVKGMSAENVRKWLKENEDSLPYKIRLEHNMKGKPISWVHLDCVYEEKNPQVYLFDV